MSLIDDVKESIPEGTYLAMCNAMKDVFEKKASTKTETSNERTTICDALNAYKFVEKEYGKRTQRNITITFNNNRIVSVMLNSIAMVRVPGEWDGPLFICRLSEGINAYLYLDDSNKVNTLEISYKTVCMKAYERSALIAKKVTQLTQ